MIHVISRYTPEKPFCGIPIENNWKHVVNYIIDETDENINPETGVWKWLTKEHYNRLCPKCQKISRDMHGLNPVSDQEIKF